MIAHDTLGIALSNIFFHLARNQSVWRKLRQQALELPEITADNLKRFDYLQHVINETLRLTSPITNMTRIALRDTVLPAGGGPDGEAPVFVAKGTILSCSFEMLHRDKEVYGDDVELWRPERWESLKLASLAWKFVPFGGGPHLCPGQHLAMKQIASCVANFLRTFARIENRDPVEEFVPKYKLVVESMNGTKVALFGAEGKTASA